MGKFKTINNDGYSLIELIIYISLVGVSLLVFTSFVVDVTKNSARAEAKIDSQYNARITLSKIVNSVRSSTNIDLSNSNLNIDNGKLALETNGSSIEYYLVDGVVMIDNNIEIYSITDDNIEFTKLFFEVKDNTVFITLKCHNSIDTNLKPIEITTSVSPRQLIYNP